MQDKFKLFEDKIKSLKKKTGFQKEIICSLEHIDSKIKDGEQYMSYANCCHSVGDDKIFINLNKSIIDEIAEDKIEEIATHEFLHAILSDLSDQHFIALRGDFTKIENGFEKSLKIRKEKEEKIVRQLTKLVSFR